MKKEVKLSGDKIKVKVKLTPYIAGKRKLRVYTQDAREMAQEAYPKEKILSVESPLTLANYDPERLEGEWSFLVEKPEKKVSSPKSIKKKSSSSKKEEVDVETPKGS